MAKVLLVEDDPSVAKIISLMLGNDGHLVFWAANGKLAFHEIAHGAYDLVISDLFMPEKDGIEVVMELRRTRPSTPVIMMTGGSSFFPTGSEHLKNLTDSAELFGDIHLMHKPFRKAELLALVQRALQKAGHDDTPQT